MKLTERWRARWEAAERNFVPSKREQIIIDVIGWAIVTILGLAGIIATVGILYVWYLAFVRGG
jgi:hypothetical protein